MVKMAELRAANEIWFGKGNRKFFGDRQYKVINYGGTAYLAQETTRWSDMFDRKPRYRWLLHPIEADLKIGHLIDREFDTFEDAKDWVKEQGTSGKPVRKREESLRMGTAKGNWGRLVRSGQGGFLNPPGHPEHEWSIHSVYGDTFSLSLSSAAKEAWLDPVARKEARAKLAAWKPLPLSDPKVQDWIHHVLGYFRGMYEGQDKAGNLSWNASDLRSRPDVDPVLNADIHAGVHFIRRYYPNFRPTAYDFQAAYWGKKPTRALMVVTQHREAGPPRLTR